MTNGSGAPAEWTSYTAYGEPTLRDSTGAQLTASAVNAQFGWNGLPHDIALGVVDMRARLYRPTLGRFLSPDPLGLVDGSNRFAFVGASPLSFRDPFGLSAKAPRDGVAESFRLHPSISDYYTQQAQEMAELEFQLRQMYDAEVRRDADNAAKAELRKTGRLFANALGFTAVVLGGMTAAAAVPVAVVAAPVVASASANIYTTAQLVSGAVVRKVVTSTATAGVADLGWGLATPEGTPDLIPGDLDTVARELRMGVSGLTRRGSSGSTKFLHGTSTASAESIVSGGLKPVSQATQNHPQGSFFTHLASHPDAHYAASAWGLRSARNSSHVKVVEMTVPNWVLKKLEESGWYKFNGNTNPDQHIFHPQGFEILNTHSIFDIIAPNYD